MSRRISAINNKLQVLKKVRDATQCDYDSMFIVALEELNDYQQSELRCLLAHSRMIMRRLEVIIE